MSVIQFMVKYSDEKDIFRIIEIKSDQTFEQFHALLQSSFGLKGKQLASFYTCDAEWNKLEEITLLDMSDEETMMPVMSKTKISEFIKEAGHKLIYVFDFKEMLEFFIEVMQIKEKTESKTKYPVVIKSVGAIPKKNKLQNKTFYPGNKYEKIKVLEEENEMLEEESIGDNFTEDLSFDTEDDSESRRFTEEDEF